MMDTAVVPYTQQLTELPLVLEPLERSLAELRVVCFVGVQ